MRDILLQLLIYAQGMWRYRWYGLLVAWGVSLAGWALVYALPNQYEVKAQVFVDTQSTLKPLLQGLAVDVDMETRVAMLTQALLSRPNLERAIRDAGFDLAASTPAQTEEILTRLQREIRVQGGGGASSLYTISYTGTDPVATQRLVQALLNVLVENTVRSSRSDTNIAQRFLLKQIQEYEARLTEAEQRLADFKRKNVGMMPGAQGDYYARLKAAMDELESTRAKLRLATNRRDELRRQIEGEEPVFGVVSPAGTFRSAVTDTPLDARIRAHQEKIEELLLRYTDKHPDVIALKEIIARLEAKKRAAGSASAGSGQIASGQTVELSPVYQRMQIALNEAEVEVATSLARVRDQERVINELKAMVDAAPEIEANLTRLNRDYSITKARYEALVQRLESARLSEKAEESRDNIKFRVTEPPVVPWKPSGPNRPLLLTGVLLLALLSGGAWAFFLNELRPVFFSSKDLRETTNLPLLGIVRMNLMPRHQSRQRRQLLSFIYATAMLIIVFGATFVFQNAGTEIARRLMGS